MRKYFKIQDLYVINCICLYVDIDMENVNINTLLCGVFRWNLNKDIFEIQHVNMVH